MRFALLLGLLTVPFGFAPAARAAPVLANLVLELQSPGFLPVSLSGVATISVTGTTVVLPGSAFPQVLPTVSFPVTRPALTASSGVAFQGGTFSLGGLTGQAAGEACPPGPRQACNVGGGIGGLLGLSGGLNVHLIPGVVVLPLDLDAMRVGQGGFAGTAPTSAYDAAGWTTRTGLVNTGTATLSQVASSPAPGFALQLVSPTYVGFLGNTLPIFATLTISGTVLPVPEAAPLALLGAALLVIVLGRRG